MEEKHAPGIEKSSSNGTRHLEPEQIAMIEEVLGTVGEYGEVRLVVEKGRIRFITASRSYDALKWRGPGGERSERRD